ncbi:sulfatase-like hydrolase/transferase [bacterium]|nr:sulfatase-like hydrolase/transferase [bacterium]
MTLYKKIKSYLALLSVVFFIACIIGSILAIRYSIINQLVQEKMIRLLFITLQQAINFWVLLFIACSIGILIFISLFYAVLQKIISDTILQTSWKNQYYKNKMAIAAFLFVSISTLAGWVANHYWLPSREHPVSLLADIVIVILGLLIGWAFLKIRWENRFNIEKTTGVIRSTGFFLLILALILNLSVFIDRKINAPKGPNVLFIIIDTLRADHLGCYGYNRNTSPNIDSLAENAIRFENAISAAPWTSPSIASMMTSQYPAFMGFHHDPIEINDKFVTLAEIFKQNNYKTKGIISHVYLSSKLKFDQGFDSFDEENARDHSHISSASITDKAIAYLEENKNKKNFLFLHYFDPHYDYMLHETYNFLPEYNGCYYSGQPIENLRAFAPCMDKEDIEYIIGLHDSEIAYTDEHIGRLFNKLKELDLFNNTLIIVTGDHGEEFLERGDYWIGHATKLYQEMIHVPLIVKPPGATKSVAKNYFGMIDLMPMIVNIDNWTIPSENECKKKISDFIHEYDFQNKPVISETKRKAKLQSVILNGWKTICDLENHTMKLFNLKDDPMELNNVTSENDSIVHVMNIILSEWNEHINPEFEGERPKFSKEQIENLRSLGYIK